MNPITNISIGFANIGSIDILVNRIIKLFQLLMATCNWYLKCIDINKKTMTLRNNNILYVIRSELYRFESKDTDNKFKIVVTVYTSNIGSISEMIKSLPILYSHSSVKEYVYQSNVQLC